MRWVWLLLMVVSGVTYGQTIELELSQLEQRVKIVLPQHYDTKRSYPAVLYYHGSGGKPNTAMIRNQLDAKEWIVVGMSYTKHKKGEGDDQRLEREMLSLKTVRHYLERKYHLDNRRCYVAGFSKGGWMVDSLLQLDASLAGGVILGAGHGVKLKRLVRLRRGLPVFVALGRLDGNFPYALRAVQFHRSRGARTTFETIPEMGHTFPREGTLALRQWFSMREGLSESKKVQAQREMQTELEVAAQLDDYAQWRRLLEIKNLPYSRWLGEEWHQLLKQKVAKLEQQKEIKDEAEFMRLHRRLLNWESMGGSIERIAKVNAGYRELIARFPSSRQCAIAKHDFERTQRLEKILRKMEENGTGKDRNREPKPPVRRRRIPKNPLVK